MPAASPFDDIRALLPALPGPDEDAAAAVRERLAPARLGHVGDLAAAFAGWRGRRGIGAERATVCVFAASHGVAVTLGASPEAARRRLDAMGAGATPTVAACGAAGLGVRAFDLALDLPGPDIAGEPAMGERDCVATIAFGMEAVAGGADAIGLAALDRSAALPAAAVLAALGSDAPARWLPAGAAGAIGPVTSALLRHGRPGPDPLAILASLGGRDVAALVGAVLAARNERAPVVLDGLPATAAAAVLAALDPGAVRHCFAATRPTGAAEAALHDRLGIEPILPALDLPPAEGLGAALALGFLKGALAAARDALGP